MRLCFQLVTSADTFRRGARNDLPAQAAHFRPLRGGQAVVAVVVIAIGLPEPVPNGLGGRLKLTDELLRRPSRPGELDGPRPQLRGIRRWLSLWPKRDRRQDP